MNNNDAFNFLTHDTEKEEYQQAVEGLGLIQAKANRPRYILRYLKDSKKKMGVALWDVVSPQLEGYNYGPNTGLPTLSLEGLIDKGVIKRD